MNHQTFNFFLIVFVSILLTLSITIDAHKLRIKPTKPKCPTCCKSRGSPGWNDIIYPIYVDQNQTVQIDNASTPHDCCNLCIADPNCVSWYYNIVSTLFIGCHHQYNTSTVDACSPPLYIPSESGDEGGVIRCNDGSNCN
ncbi:641_t:CDS:1 [Cetraspora pellucida]|uniref:641_t:CDS:1 n=1 Tax=Cetraspora pellucida TaxID=1433469 RepID=A0A9N9IIK9_9GLOM|nr:641_t:CDS:1 [Cetraspora pellucida]